MNKKILAPLLFLSLTAACGGGGSGTPEPGPNVNPDLNFTEITGSYIDLTNTENSTALQIEEEGGELQKLEIPDLDDNAVKNVSFNGSTLTFNIDLSVEDPENPNETTCTVTFKNNGTAPYTCKTLPADETKTGTLTKCSDLTDAAGEAECES